MAFLRRTLAVSLSLLIALSSASEDELLPLSAAMVADDACSSSATCSLELLQRRGAVTETVPVSLGEQAVTTQELPDQFCRNRREEGFHCDGKKRVRCIREGFEWRAGFKKECDFACRRGECSYMLGQLDAKEEQEEVSQEAVATQETWRTPDQFCRDRREEGFHCDGKMRIRCRREGFEWMAGFKKRCDFECRWGECRI
ncbi:unnamed protein product [Polarella glacialis]|uniref:Uncharacterized protein n=1 Tax=Polarella glacialis TaxID=89957 RepID=A0A813M0U7_POLGL|nr:unnamed protein product [Polarella glacialis]CAE8743530.1 unnamed protein product [Polarella glacialis]